MTAALRAAPATVWLRSGRETPAREVMRSARSLREITHTAGVALYVGDRLDVALACGADGVHLPERSFAPTTLAPRLPLRRSRAVHDLAGALTHAASCDVIVASPFGAVPGKGPALGVDGLRALVSAAGATPLLALGGVRDGEDVRRCRSAGARGVVVRGALMDADDPGAACAALWDALQG